MSKEMSNWLKTASFNNSYFCYHMLPKDLMFVHLLHNNSKNNFIGSKMRKEKNETSNI